MNLQLHHRPGPVALSRAPVTPSTSHAVLVGCSLQSPDRPRPANQVRRYEHPSLRELLHVDVKKLGNLIDGRWHCQDPNVQADGRSPTRTAPAHVYAPRAMPVCVVTWSRQAPRSPQPDARVVHTSCVPPDVLVLPSPYQRPHPVDDAHHRSDLNALPNQETSVPGDGELVNHVDVVLLVDDALAELDVLVRFGDDR